jgi:uncharacterized protein with HEPN domain
MQAKLLKYILDVESVIKEIESVQMRVDNNFQRFQADIILQRAIERDLEILGEAVKKIVEMDASIQISGSRNIVNLRNLIAYAYDTVDVEIIWSIIQKDVRVLKQEIEEIRRK